MAERFKQINQQQEIENGSQRGVNQIDLDISIDGASKALDYIQEQRKQQKSELILRQYQLGDLDCIKGWIWEELRVVNISQNNICNIEPVCQYEKLQFLDASFNFIEEVNLYLPELRVLNLQNNKLKEFPVLGQMTKLKELNLNTNKITSIENAEVGFIPNLQTLDLGSNAISFDTEEQFMEFIDKMKELTKLTDLTVEGNPFFTNEEQIKFTGIIVKDEILESLKGLENFNGETHSMQSQRNQAENDKKKKKGKLKPPPTIDDLLYHLESANSHPSNALDHLKDLAQDTDQIIQNIDLVPKYFAANRGEDQVKEDIETFMQNVILLIDNHQEHQGTILSVLAKLTIMKFQDFGVLCFDTMKELMQSGREMENTVTQILKKEVIQLMRVPDPLDIPASLLIGMNELIEVTGLTSLVGAMYRDCFGKWLNQYCVELRNHLRSSGVFMGNHEHYDSIMNLIAVSIKDDDDNIEMVIDQGMTKQICMIMSQSTWDHDRYIPCLDLIACLANSSTQAADDFMQNLMHQNLLNQIKKSITIYKKNNSLFDEHSKETVDQQLLKYQTLASEIETMGGLLQSSSDYRVLILDEPVIIDLISIMGHKKTDPILLKAICTFALDLFESDELRYDAERMEPFHKQMADMKMLIPYLGMGRYPDLLVMTGRYHDAEGGGEQNMDISQSNVPQQDLEDEDNLHQHMESLRHLDDPIVNDLFISIIHLMRYFCLEAEQNESNKLFDAISQSLNENNREDALFNALAIPDDNVRLAVVQCLFVVPLDELDTAEIEQICGIMTTCSNIAAGQTELVLSVIYWICGKFVQGDLENSDCPPSCRIFQLNFGEKTMSEALDILNRNLQRIVGPDEDHEKYALSISILNFIKSSSQAPMMQKYMIGKDHIFKQILMNEELYSSSRVGILPIDVENTVVGSNVNCLLSALQEYLHPYNNTSLRVIMRIADILMDRNYCKTYDINESEDVIDCLMTHQEKIYKKKKSLEEDYWIDLPLNYFADKNQDDLDELNAQHYNFTQGNGQGIIIEFLISQFPENEMFVKSLCDDCFIEKFTQEEKDKDFLTQITEFREQKEKKFKEKYIGVDEKKQDYYKLRKAILEKNRAKPDDSQTQQNDPQDKESAMESEALDPIQQKANLNTSKGNVIDCRQTQQYEKLGIDLIEQNILDGKAHGHELLSYDQKLTSINEKYESMKKKRSDSQKNKLHLLEQRGDGFLNNKIRALTVAALLRCLYGAIEGAPTVELKNSAINNIKDPKLFRGITQLCDSTDWDENCNISSKYLRVMRHVIKLAHCKGVENFDMLQHYKMISMVIEKSLVKIINKLNNDIPLTDGDQVANYEVSLTFFTIVQQSNNFSFSSYDIVKLHLENEIKIQRQLQRKQDKILSDDDNARYKKMLQDCLLENPEDKKPKCQYEEVDYNPNKVTHENYKVQLPDLRKKRSIQQKVVEFMVLKMFSQKSIFTLVDILFKDMKEDHKSIMSTKITDGDDLLEGDEVAENSGIVVDEEGKDEEEEESEDETKYGVDIDDYMGTKGVLTIERIKDIVGEIMNSCQKKMKYQILEKIMKGVIFKKKQLRQSFMQEVLNASDSASFKNALEMLMKNNRYTIASFYCDNPSGGTDMNWGTPAGLGSVVYEPEFCKCNYFPNEWRLERIIEFCQLDLNNKFFETMPPGESFQVDDSFVKRLFVMTTQGIQIMKYPEVKQGGLSIGNKSSKCNDCPPQKFCPRGPVQDLCIRYSQIESITCFPQLPQKLVLIYVTKCFKENGERMLINGIKWQLTLNIPTYTKCSKLYRNLLNILRCVHTEKENAKVDKRSYHIRDNYALSDKLVQYHLRKVIQLVNPALAKEKINQKTLTFASLTKLTFLEKSFKKEVLKPLESTEDNLQLPIVRIRPIPESEATKKGDKDKKKKDTPLFGGLADILNKDASDGQDLVIKDSVLVCIIDRKVLIIKEKWHNWQSFPEPEQMRERKKNEKKLEGALKKNNVTAAGETPTPEGEKDIDRSSLDSIRSSMTEVCSTLETALFKIVAFISVEDIDQVFMIRGKDPMVEIRCFGTIEADKSHSFSILFPGDMERQRFIDELIDEWRKEESNDIVEDTMMGEFQKPQEEGDSDDEMVGAKDEESDEEEICFTIYD